MKLGLKMRKQLDRDDGITRRTDFFPIIQLWEKKSISDNQVSRASTMILGILSIKGQLETLGKILKKANAASRKQHLVLSRDRNKCHLEKNSSIHAEFSSTHAQKQSPKYQVNTMSNNRSNWQCPQRLPYQDQQIKNENILTQNLSGSLQEQNE